MEIILSCIQFSGWPNYPKQNKNWGILLEEHQFIILNFKFGDTAYTVMQRFPGNVMAELIYKGL